MDDPDPDLTPLERRLYTALTDAAGQVLSRDDLGVTVWGEPQPGRAVDNVVSRLRAKVGADRVVTVRGRGWRVPAAQEFEPEPDATAPTTPTRRLKLAGGVRVDLAGASARVAGQAVSLTDLEVRTLAYLADRPGERVEHDTLLTEVWGWRPGLETQAVTRSLQRLRAKIGTEALASHAGTWRLVEVRGNLGHGPELVGRTAELSTLAEGVDASRLVTITGPGGVGKTTLAIALAADPARAPQWPDGVWFVNLCRASTATEVDTVVLEALGATGDPGSALAQRGQALLVLDNCEHLLDAAAARTSSWLAGAPDLQILATSRRPLAIVEEAVFELGPMSSDDAVQLLQQRAPRGTAPDPAAGAEIVRCVDRLPLAVELAAARLKVLGPDELIARLDTQALDAVVKGPSDAHTRRRSLRGTVTWSWDLLSASERELLVAAAIFRGPFERRALERVAAVDDDAVLDGLEHLLDASLVQRVDGPERRFRLLRVVREFALEQGPIGAQRGRHLGWASDGAATAWAARRGAEPASAEAWVRDHLPDLLEALEHARDPDAAAPIALAVSFVVPVTQALEALGRAWALEPSGATRGALALAQGNGRVLIGDTDGSLALFELALDAGTPGDRILALRGLGVAAARRGDGAAEHRYLSEGVALGRAEPGVEGAEALYAYAEMLQATMSDDERSKMVDEALAQARAAGGSRTLARILRNRGVSRMFDDDLPGARLDLEEARALADRIGERAAVEAEADLAWLAAHERRDEPVEAPLRRAVAYHREGGRIDSRTYHQYRLGSVLLDGGRAREALDVFADAFASHTALGVSASAAVHARCAGLCCEHLGATDHAREWYLKAIEAAQASSHPIFGMAAGILLAVVAARQNDATSADRALREAEPKVRGVSTLETLYELARAQVDWLAGAPDVGFPAPDTFREPFVRSLCRLYANERSR